MLRGVGLIAICLALFSPPSYGRWQDRFDACVDHPTLAEEINPQPQTDQNQEAKQTHKVRVASLTFEGTDNLPDAVKEQVIRQMDEASYETISPSIQASQETIRDALRNQGYFYAASTASTNFVRNEKELSLKVAFQVSEGPQYRLTEIHFANAKAFPAAELRKQFPIQDGDIFSLATIREGMEKLDQLYSSRGYINLQPSPDISPDRNHQQVSVLINMDEGAQFRVGSVEVFGLDQQFWGPTLKSGLVAGKVFDPGLVRAVFSEDKSVLPPDASEEHDLHITQDPRNATVAIVFDFRRCR